MDEDDELEVPLDDLLNDVAPAPTDEFRRRAWRVFQQALDRLELSRARRSQR